MAELMDVGRGRNRGLMAERETQLSADDPIGGSGITCWRRLREWTDAGVWPAPHELLLGELGGR